MLCYAEVLLRKFCIFLTGEFDNKEQVAALDAAAAAGDGPARTHPLARHVTRVVTDRMKNLPMDLASGQRGVFLLEESDYEHPPAGEDGQPRLEVKPLLLFVEPREDSKGSSQLWLHSYRFASSAYVGGNQAGRLAAEAAEGLRNASPELSLDFAEICPSPTFAAAPYDYDAEAERFSISATIDLGDTMSFTLSETLSAAGLDVMEMLSKGDGSKRVKLTPYSTPIQYRRVAAS